MPHGLQVHNDGLHTHSDGLRNDGLHNDGLHNDGLHNDGLHNDGLHNDGLHNDGLRNDGLRNDGLRNDGLHIGFFAEKITPKLKYILNQNLSVVDAIPPLTLPNDVGCYQENRCFESKFRRHSEIRVGIILIIS